MEGTGTGLPSRLGKGCFLAALAASRCLWPGSCRHMAVIRAVLTSTRSCEFSVNPSGGEFPSQDGARARMPGGELGGGSKRALVAPSRPPSPYKRSFECCRAPSRSRQKSSCGLQRWKPRGAAKTRQPGWQENARAMERHPGEHTHGLPLSTLLPRTYPNEAEPRVIQQQNRTKNNLLVLMGLVLSLPRTFQPGSRDRSGRGGRGG